MLIGHVNNGYNIIKEVVLSRDIAVVLAERNDHEMYCTWLACDCNYTGTFAYYHGHYIVGYLDAMEDFWLRVKFEVELQLKRIIDAKEFD